MLATICIAYMWHTYRSIRGSQLLPDLSHAAVLRVPGHHTQHRFRVDGKVGELLTKDPDKMAYKPIK